MTNVIDLTKYYEICQTFFYSNVRVYWIDYNCFFDDVGRPAINEATKVKGSNYPPDGRFFNLLKNRYTDYLRKLHKQKVEYTSDNKLFNNKDTIATISTPLENSISLIDDYINRIDNIKINDKTIGTIFYNIAKENNITHFLNIPIDQILPIFMVKSVKSQNRNYHKNRFRILLNNYEGKIPQSFSVVPDDEIANDESNSRHYIKEGFDARDEALKALGKSKLETNAKEFFICFLYFLKASILFQKAIELDVDNITALYNLAFIQKRLGFFPEAKDKLNVLLNMNLPEDIESMVYECLGDTHLLQADLYVALKHFKKALTHTPKDHEVNFNILRTYFELDEFNDNNDKLSNVDKTLITLLKINKPTPKMRHKLLDKIMNRYNEEVATKALLVKKLK